jgi:hypothetical protein
LDKTYKDTIISAFKKSISKFKDLQNVSYNREEDGWFRREPYRNYFKMDLEGFGNYAYEKHEHDTSKAIRLTNKFKEDLTNLSKMIQSSLPKNSKLHVAVTDVEGDPLTELISNLVHGIKEGRTPSNDALLTVYISVNDVKIASEDEVQNAKEREYLKIYEEFIKFMKKPHALNNSLCSGQIADICRIKGISSKRLNEVVAKNVTRIGTPKDIIPNSFAQPDYGEDVSEILGKCYILESLDGTQLVYSIRKKRLYWIDYEHCAYNIFYDNCSSYSREFADAAFGYDDQLKKRLLELFGAFDKENGIMFTK